MTDSQFDIEFLKCAKSIKRHIAHKCSYNNILSEDIYQDLYLRAKKAVQRNKYNEQGKFNGWLKHMASNLITDHWRREHRRNKFLNFDSDVFDIMDVMVEPICFEEEMIQEEELDRMMKLVDLLPKEQSFVVKRIVIDGMAFSDLVEETGIGLNTLLGRKRYALINLRKVI